eukprot:CAMPEP_0170069158 /NCGR_PEP_ID=MMETSP0019_2-20121128/7919_1 /TAXON_ID=98059 /ORGANISM="Dinobryon sp., Strain UTEXLB2267" /LENGTH=102 /DNA_ID=CAMNT_0010277095 /DNA_START=570 /DNA_END=875 /DNA_ORIENTATION=-
MVVTEVGMVMDAIPDCSKTEVSRNLTDVGMTTDSNATVLPNPKSKIEVTEVGNETAVSETQLANPSFFTMRIDVGIVTEISPEAKNMNSEMATSEVGMDSQW